MNKKRKKKMLRDIDGDGVINILDCDMFDPDAQDYNPNVITPSPTKKKNIPMLRGIPVSEYYFDMKKMEYVPTPSAKKRSNKRRPKWNKVSEWVWGSL